MENPNTTDLHRKILVPPQGSEEHFAFKAIEQVLNLALNIHLGNLQEKGFLSKAGQTASTAWVNDKPGPMLQLKFDTMDQILELLTPNLVKMCRDFYYQRPVNPKVPPVDGKNGDLAAGNALVSKSYLYLILRNYSLSVFQNHFEMMCEQSITNKLSSLTISNKSHNLNSRMFRLSRLTNHLPENSASPEITKEDVDFLNHTGTVFLKGEKEDPYFPFAVEILNGLAYLAKDNKDLNMDEYQIIPYDPERSMRELAKH